MEEGKKGYSLNELATASDEQLKSMGVPATDIPTLREEMKVMEELSQTDATTELEALNKIAKSLTTFMTHLIPQLQLLNETLADLVYEKDEETGELVIREYFEMGEPEPEKK